MSLECRPACGWAHFVLGVPWSYGLRDRVIGLNYHLTVVVVREDDDLLTTLDYVRI